MNSRLLRGATTFLAVLLLSTALTLPATAAESPTPGAEAEAAAKTGTGRTVFGDGHIDIGPRFDQGRWTVQIRDDTSHPAIWRNTGDVVLQVKDAAKIEVPTGEEFGFPRQARRPCVAAAPGAAGRRAVAGLEQPGAQDRRRGRA
ncbi:hypothetical protein ACWEFD_35045 [Streptomyces ardesiacus]